MNQHSYSRFVRMIVDRPLVNITLVLAATMMMAITGFGALDSAGIKHQLLASLGQFGLGFSFALLLPFILRFLLLGTGIERAIGFVGLIGGIWIIVSAPDLLVGGDQPPITFSVLNFILLSFGLGLMSWGVVWCERLSGVVLLAIPVLLLALFASGGMMVRMGFIVGGQIDPSAAAMVIFAIAFGAQTAFGIGLSYSHALDRGRLPRDAASEAVSEAVTPVSFGFFLIAAIAVLGMLFSSDGVLDLPGAEGMDSGSGPGFGIAVAGFAALGVLLVLPGFLWLMEARREGASAGAVFEPPGFARLWRQVRTVLPNPSAYALIFMMAIICIVIIAANPTRPTLAETIFLVLVIALSGLNFASLRVFIMSGILLTMALIVCVGVLSLAQYGEALSPAERLVASALGALLLGDIVRRFRDISAGERRPRAVVMRLMREATGPYMLYFGTLITIMVAADMSGLWPNAGFVAVQFTVMAGGMFVLLPAVATILAARYGRF